MKKNITNTALLVVDVQKGLFEQKTPIYKEIDLLNKITILIDNFRKNNITVIFIQHANKGILKFESDGWQLHPLIKPINNEIIIQKNNGSAFKETNMQKILDKHNIKKLIVAGLTTHGCIKATCLDGVKLGYEVILVEDAHSSYNKKADELIKTWNFKLSEKGINLIRTCEISSII